MWELLQLRRVEDPMKSEEVTDDQLSVLGALTRVGIAPYADFGVWKPFGQRAAKNLKLKPAGACSELRPSCASQRQLFCTCMHLGSGREWTDSRIPGTCVFWRTQGADRSCGRLSTVVKRNSTNSIQKIQHLYPFARGTASLKPRRMPRFLERGIGRQSGRFSKCAPNYQQVW